MTRGCTLQARPRRGRAARGPGRFGAGVVCAGVVGLGLVAGLALTGPVAAVTKAYPSPRAGVPCADGGPCQRGDVGPGGGVVFYDAGSVQPWGRYLEVAPTGWSGSVKDPVVAWCNGADTLGAAPMDSWIGAGAANTRSMLAACSSGAANLAVSYTSPVFETSPSVSATEPAVTTPLSAATAPRGVRATPSRGSATVSWQEPSSDGGSAITGYVVIANPGARSCSTVRLTCKVNGLRAGRYTFSVTARNGIGLGEIAISKTVRVPVGSTRARETASKPMLGPTVLAGGKSDWYLPSKDELIVLGSFLSGGWWNGPKPTARYWSSSQYSATTAWQDDFAGYVSVSYSPVPKTYVLSVRPIRAF